MAIMQSNALRAQLKAGLNAALCTLKPLMLLLRTAVLHEPSTVLTGERFICSLVDQPHLPQLQGAHHFGRPQTPIHSHTHI